MRIGLLHRQQPFAEYINGRWRIYVIFNNDVTGGTYFELEANGNCDRVTFRDSDVVSVQRIATAPVVDEENLSRVCETCLEQEFIQGCQL